jgi:Domain of unknown function (DUF5753)
VTARRRGLRRRAERQRRLLREDGPAVALLIDMPALYRAVGSAEVMAAQCAHLAEIARLDGDADYQKISALLKRYRAQKR